MKYRLLRDLPTIPAGEEIEVVLADSFEGSLSMPEKKMYLTPEKLRKLILIGWIEEIKPKEPREWYAIIVKNDNNPEFATREKAQSILEVFRGTEGNSDLEVVKVREILKEETK